MPKSHLVSFDTPTRKTVRLHEQDAHGEIVLETKADISPVLEMNKVTRNRVDERAPWKEGDLVARIPPVVYWNLPPEIRNDPEEFDKWLNHTDQMPFRARLGQV